MRTEGFQYRNGNEGVRYTLVQDDSEIVQFNGTIQLNELLATVAEDTYVEVEYIRDVETDQPQPAKIFSVLAEITD